MITNTLLRLVEDRINEKFKAYLVPIDKAYPTSGRRFIRVAGNSLSLTLDGDSLKCELQIVVTCSIRSRTKNVQSQQELLGEIIDLAEMVYFHLLLDLNINSKILNSFPTEPDSSRISVDGRWECNYVDLRAEPVYADFYDAREVHERMPAGMKVDITLLAPRIWIPIGCGTLPFSLQTELDTSEIKYDKN